MAVVFPQCENTVVLRQSTCATTPQFLTITLDGVNMYDNGLLTGVSVAMAGNYQFLHTVSNFVYLYAFGDRVSVLNLTGIGFVKTCDNASKTQIQKVYDFYKTRRIAKKTEPMDIVITSTGNEANFKFRGYLTGMNIDLKQSDPLGTVGFWNMKFEAVID